MANPGADSRQALDPCTTNGEKRFYLSFYQGIDHVVEICWQSVVQELRRRGFGPREHDIHLAMVEAIVNAWKHGSKSNPDLPITFRWSFQEGFTFEVEDLGRGFDFNTPPDPTSPERLHEPNGRGLFIIRRVAAEVEWRDQGRHLIVNFTREGHCH